MELEARVPNNVLERMLLDKTVAPSFLPLSLLENITNGFSDDLVIGSGGFAKVYKGILGKGRIVAVKKLSQGQGIIDEKKFLDEVTCMKAKHKNIVRFLGYCGNTQQKLVDHKGKMVMADEQQMLLCFEYLENGSLHNYIHDPSRGLEWRKRYQIIKGICEGLQYLHLTDIIHLDLKPANILLDVNMAPKIADFGLSRWLEENQSHAVASKVYGTRGYLAPEADNRQLRRQLDIYSLGVVITEIVTGKKGHSPVDHVIESWTTRSREAPSTMLEEQVRLCHQIGIACMNMNPNNRPDVQYIIQMLNKWEADVRPSEVHVPVKTPYRQPQSIETSVVGSAKNGPTIWRPQPLQESSKTDAATTKNKMKTGILYTTTLSGITKTFKNCNIVRAALQLRNIQFVEKDLFDRPDNLKELRTLTNGKPYILPVLFINGKYVGDAPKLLKLIDQGGLAALFH